MDALALTVVIAIIGAAISLLFRERLQRSTRPTWRAAAAEHRLQVVDPDTLAGEVDGIVVHARTFTTPGDREPLTWTEITCDVPGGIRAQLAWDGFPRPLPGLAEVDLGDQRFDSAVRWRGDRVEALAVLGAPERELVANNVYDGWRYEPGTWTLRVPGHLGVGLGPMIARGRALARVTRLDPASIDERLQARAASDPNSSVRRLALEALVARDPAGPRTRAALAHGLGDRDGWVRLVAALEAGAMDVVAALAADVAALPVGARTRFVHGLATRPVPGREALAVARLADDDPEVRIGAARALGSIGTIPGAVPALVPLRDKVLGGALAVAARAAILAIQERVGDPSWGGLAVVDDSAAGRLTLSEGAHVEHVAAAEPSDPSAPEVRNA